MYHPPRMTVGSLIVTPTYNERDNLEVLVAGVFEALPEAHILVVDDASPDGTGTLAEELAGRDARVHVLHRARKLGLGTAYLEGFAWGLARDYGYFFEIDADLSHDPKYLPGFVEALDRGADLVKFAAVRPERADIEESLRKAQEFCELPGTCAHSPAR